MKSAFLYFALFVAVANVQANVIIEKVNLKTEFYGPFNKSRLEIIFLNPTERDSLEGFFSFTTNKSAIVNELWLEIDGELKEAKRLSCSQTVGDGFQKMTNGILWMTKSS